MSYVCSSVQLIQPLLFKCCCNLSFGCANVTIVSVNVDYVFLLLNFIPGFFFFFFGGGGGGGWLLFLLLFFGVFLR